MSAPDERRALPLTVNPYPNWLPALASSGPGDSLSCYRMALALALSRAGAGDHATIARALLPAAADLLDHRPPRRFRGLEVELANDELPWSPGTPAPHRVSAEGLSGPMVAYVDRFHWPLSSRYGRRHYRDHVLLLDAVDGELAVWDTEVHETTRVEVDRDELGHALSQPATLVPVDPEPLPSWLRSWLGSLRTLGAELSTLAPEWRSRTVWWPISALRGFFLLTHAELVHGVNHCRRDPDVAAELARLDVDLAPAERLIRALQAHFVNTIEDIALRVDAIHRSTEELATALLDLPGGPVRAGRTGTEVVDALALKGSYCFLPSGSEDQWLVAGGHRDAGQPRVVRRSGTAPAATHPA
ncbi:MULTISPECIES: hypothetical protein [Micromonospora]|uniref:hypothetical protein n=1 Tax=Micromonospora TaxID=1873 RepID=UPI00064C1424|nr:MULTISPECIES: hypothetical protein [Micromonospora]MDG4750886.1 hypothetical protein [Micromonospora sp. WMMD718]UFN96865.1 hypothetical protein LF814_12370 [Micromonospora aurantiaca]